MAEISIPKLSGCRVQSPSPNSKRANPFWITCVVDCRRPEQGCQIRVPLWTDEEILRNLLLRWINQEKAKAMAGREPRDDFALL